MPVVLIARDCFDWPVVPVRSKDSRCVIAQFHTCIVCVDSLSVHSNILCHAFVCTDYVQQWTS